MCVCSLLIRSLFYDNVEDFKTPRLYLGVKLNTGIKKNIHFMVKVYHMDDEAGSNFYLNAHQ